MSFESKIRSTVISTTAVSTLIKDRFYEGQIATVLADPSVRVEFPCGCFEVYGGDIDVNISKIQMAFFNVWSWSEHSYDQAKKVYDAIFNSLDTQRLSDSQVRFVCKAMGVPTRTYDPDNKTYVLMAGWRATVIGI